jgi:hypothetical protein
MVDAFEIRQVLDQYFDIWGQPSVMPDGTVHVQGEVVVGTVLPAHMPVKFGQVTGDFKMASPIQTQLTSLVGCPHTVMGSFRCVAPLIKTLEGAPQHVGKKCVIASDALTSLEHLPTYGETLLLRYTPHLPLLRLLEHARLLWSYSPKYGGMEQGMAATHILKKYQSKGRAGALACAAELIRAGYKWNARW